MSAGVSERGVGMSSPTFRPGDRIEWRQGPRGLRRSGVVVSARNQIARLQVRRDSTGELCYVTPSANPVVLTEERQQDLGLVNTPYGWE